MSELSQIEAKLDELLQIERMNARNIFTLYRRMTALAHMVEAVSDGREPRLPKVVRAEIDASVNPEAFEELARKDKQEFTHRYGEDVYNLLQRQGIDSISKIGEFAPARQEFTVN
jgi:hypothetical protein